MSINNLREPDAPLPCWRGTVARSLPTRRQRTIFEVELRTTRSQRNKDVEQCKLRHFGIIAPNSSLGLSDKFTPLLTGSQQDGTGPGAHGRLLRHRAVPAGGGDLREQGAPTAEIAPAPVRSAAEADVGEGICTRERSRPTDRHGGRSASRSKLHQSRPVQGVGGAEESDARVAHLCCEISWVCDVPQPESGSS